MSRVLAVVIVLATAVSGGWPGASPVFAGSGLDPASELHNLEQARRRLDEVAAPDCGSAGPGAIRQLDEVFARFLDLRCGPGGHLLVARPAYYVQFCIRACGGNVVFFSAADRLLATPASPADREFIARLELAAMGDDAKAALVIAGPPPTPAIPTLRRIYGSALDDVRFLSARIVTVTGRETRMILLDDPKHSDTLHAFLMRGDEMLPFGMTIAPIRPLEEAARKNPRSGG